MRHGIGFAIAVHVRQSPFPVILYPGSLRPEADQGSPSAYWRPISKIWGEDHGDVRSMPVDLLKRRGLVDVGESRFNLYVDGRHAYQPQVGFDTAIGEVRVGQCEYVANTGAGVASVKVYKVLSVERQHVDRGIVRLGLIVLRVCIHQAFVDIRHSVFIGVHEDIGVRGADCAVAADLDRLGEPVDRIQMVSIFATQYQAKFIRP